MNIFTNLYKIINSEDNLYTIEISDETHPVFLAHFPTKPILPGFLLIDIFSQLYSCEIIKINKAKFISMVLPKDTISFRVEEKGCIIKLLVEDLNKKKIAEIFCEKR